MSNNERPTPTREVVVGVDGSPAAVQALRYAVAEAERLGTGVHVVHAVPTFVPMAPMYPLPVEDLTTAGRTVVRRTVEEAKIPPTVHVRTTLALQGAVPALVAASHDAVSVVLGADRRPVAARIFTGNVSTGVAASATMPVVTVPEDWPQHESTGTVLVGVKRPDHAAAVLAEGFAAAQARGASLVVMHAWRLPSGYDDVIMDRTSHREWEDRARHEMAAAVAEWRAAYPDVDVELRAVHDQASHARVHASGEVDEIVLVRRAHGVPSALHLGPTSRAVLAHADCPVRIVPARHAPQAPDLVLEDAGALTK